MLIGTNTDMTYKEVKYGLGNVSVGDYQPIYDIEDVCKYVTNHIEKNVDYDIVFKEISYTYFPIQNLLKILPNNSSFVISPDISPRK